MRSQTKSLVVLALLFSSLAIIHLASISNVNFINDDKKASDSLFPLKSGYPPVDITPSDIKFNGSTDYAEIRRFYDTINITLHNINETFLKRANFGYNLSELDIYINVTFANGSLFNYTMEKHLKSNITSWTFSPKISDPVGVYNISFSLFNISENMLVNTQATNKSFTVLNNMPRSSAYLNATKIYRNEFLKVDISPTDIEDPLSKLNWSINIIDPSDKVIKAIGNNLLTFTQEIDESFMETIYFRVQINVTDLDQNTTITEFIFQVINTPPEIPTSLVIVFPSKLIKRVTDTVEITVNVTDTEDSFAKINVSMTLEDTNGVETIYDFTNNVDGSFDVDFTIPATSPLGRYNIKITATDSKTDTAEHIDFITVINNDPEILGYSINNLSTSSNMTVLYGQDLVFTFNISDVEPIEGLGFVCVCLLNPNNEWFNLSIKYSENASLTVRTEDLVDGRWLVYIFVIDADGKEVGLKTGLDDAPQEIVIQTSTSALMTWIAVIIALAFGFVIGFLVFSVINSRKKSALPTPKLKEKAPTKAKGKPVVTKKPKEPKKKEEISKKPEEKPAESEEEKKSEKPKPTSQLKIKRKLK